MTSTGMRTRSAASVGKRSSFPSAYRYSTTIFEPGLQPSSFSLASNRSRWRKASPGGGLPGDRTPSRGTLAACCARAASGHATAATEQRHELAAFELHLVGAGEQKRRDFDADGPGGFKIDNQFELVRCLDRQVGRIRAAQDTINIRRGAPVLAHQIDSVNRQSSVGRPVTERIDCRNAMTLCRSKDRCPIIRGPPSAAAGVKVDGGIGTDPIGSDCGQAGSGCLTARKSHWPPTPRRRASARPR